MAPLGLSLATQPYRKIICAATSPPQQKVSEVLITKHAKNTQGGLATAGGGTEERAFGGARYGVQLGAQTYMRAYAQSMQRDGLVDTAGNTTPDGWHLHQGGLRLDWQPSAPSAVMLQGDLYGGAANELRPVALLQPPFQQIRENPIDLFGGHALARWQYTFANASISTVQLYYDRTEFQGALLAERRNTVDLDMQYQYTLGTWQALVMGLGYRWTQDDTRGSAPLRFVPDQRSRHLFNAFVQDDITLVPSRLQLTLGSRFERYDTLGFEVQPNARLLWTPHAHHTVWAVFSRALRAPARVDEDIRLRIATLPPGAPGNPGPLPIALTITGDRDVRAEEVLAYELGYRLHPLPPLAFDLAAFYNVYRHLTSLESGTPRPDRAATGPFLTLPLRFDNQQDGETFGVELVTDWQPFLWWRLQALYTYLNLHLRLNSANSAPVLRDLNVASPQHQFSLRSSWDLPGHLSADLWLRYVDALPSIGVRGYTTFDLRLAWHPLRQLEVALVGQNLPNGHPSEFVERGVVSSAIQRGVYGKLTWHF
jgi:iron complex outermembrane receptor protein